MATLQVYCGDTRQVNLTFTNPDGSAVNISGYTIYYTVKQSYDQSTVISKVLTGNGIIGVSGMAVMTLNSGDTTLCSQDYLACFTLQDLSTGYSTFATDGLTILPTTFIQP